MIATLKTAFVFSILLFFSLRVNANPPNRFQKIAQEYNIHPYNLENGYPIRYKWDEKPVRGIIYLSNEIPYLEKLDGRTYVGQPTLENAKIMANFSAEPVDIAKYYLIVDSTVNYKELSLFLEELIGEEIFMDICFVGGNGKYVNVEYNNWESLRDDHTRMLINTRNIFEVLINGNDDLLVENSFTDKDLVYAKIINYYLANIYSDDQDVSVPNYRSIDLQTCVKEVEKLEFELEQDSSKKILFEFLIEGWNERKTLAQNFKQVREMSINSGIFVKSSSRNPCSLSAWFNLLDQIQLGVHLARNAYSKIKFNLDYLDMIYRVDPIYLKLLEFTLPDAIRFSIETDRIIEEPIR
jgi:hypothetical protein